jgi:phosphatidylinositol dimannoside acyltransferase
MAALRSGLLARAFADALCLYVIPASTALLPWRLGFAWLRVLARASFLHRDSVESLWAGAAPFFADADPRRWKYRARLLLLVEHTDTYLTLLRSDRWWRRHIAVHGEFPAADSANMLLTFHWGTGNWVWRLLRAHGIGAWFLARRPHGRSLGLSRLSHWYGQLRGWSLRRIGSAGVIFTGDSADAIRRALAEKSSVTGMLDVGARAGQQTVAGMLLDRQARLPFGLARIAQETGTAVTLFSVGLDWNSGDRDLAIEVIPAGTDAAGIMRAYIAHLDARLRGAPEAWQMWHEAPAIFAQER